MPEYLAPGVYVEETSFRAKSIEGVGTSTTGFVGPTRKGPIGDTPELITNFGDFERIYGGLDDLALASGTNYLAHAARSYFNEGGSRLYVSRVYMATSETNTGRASSPFVVQGSSANERARFVARTPGDAGNGGVFVRQVAAPATVRSLLTAPEGTLVRTGGAKPKTPALLVGGIPQFAVANGSKLLLTVDGTNADITFKGAPAEATGTAEIADTVTINNTNNQLRVVIDGTPQTITLPAGETSRANLVSAINSQLRGGSARLVGGPTNPNRLVLTTKRRGSLASIQVLEHDALGFEDDTDLINSPAEDNNVGDLNHITPAEIDALLRANNIKARAALQPSTGRFVLTTQTLGTGAQLAIRGDAASSHVPLGLAAGAPVAKGAGELDLKYYVKQGNNWLDADGAALNLTGLRDSEAPEGGADIMTMNVVVADKDGGQIAYEGLGFDAAHPRYVGKVLALTPTRRSDALENVFAIEIGRDVSGFELRSGLFAAGDENIVSLTGGNDGGEPNQAAYEDALQQLELLEDIAIVAAPGHSAYTDFRGIQTALISHAERRKAYRIAVLDTPPDMLPSEARTVRSQIDSKYAALYYPWVVVSNPQARPGADNIPREIALPPSGFVCGIYARNDIERGVFKAPANEVVRSALRFESDINFAQQEVLNPLGVNCLRYFPGRGYRVWGARTASSDPEWKYVNIRRYFNYVERSIDQGTQWAVFEPNGERLWANVRDTISAFLYNEWIGGALLGSSPREAFFVRCDRSTMTQNDLDNGRLICLIGVAVVKPAEFVIFRIGQKTADARS